MSLQQPRDKLGNSDRCWMLRAFFSLEKGALLFRCSQVLRGVWEFNDLEDSRFLERSSEHPAIPVCPVLKRCKRNAGGMAGQKSGIKKMDILKN